MFGFPVLFDDVEGVEEGAVVDLLPHAAGFTKTLVDGLQLRHGDSCVQTQQGECAQELALVHSATVVSVCRLETISTVQISLTSKSDTN